MFCICTCMHPFPANTSLSNNLMFASSTYTLQPKSFPSRLIPPAASVDSCHGKSPVFTIAWQIIAVVKMKNRKKKTRDPFVGIAKQVISQYRIFFLVTFSRNDLLNCINLKQLVSWQHQACSTEVICMPSTCNAVSFMQ